MDKGKLLNKLIEGNLADPDWHKHLTNEEIDSEIDRQHKIDTEIAALNRITRSRNTIELNRAMSNYRELVAELRLTG